MRILVTGAAGFFASWLIPVLLEAGHEVIGYDLVSGQDLHDPDTLRSNMAGRDAVIHLAAYPHYRPEIPAQQFTRRNIIGTARVVEAMHATGVSRLVYTSSGALYGFGPGRPLEGWVKPPVSEAQYPGEDEWELLDVYGASKLACERWLAALCAYAPALTVTALRINCIEPYHDGALQHGAHWGWWCSQSLAAGAFLAALKRDRGGFEAVNVGEDNPNLDLTKLHLLLGGDL